MTIRRELSEAGIEYEDVVVKVEMVDETFIYNAEMCRRLQRGNFVEGKDLLCIRFFCIPSFRCFAQSSTLF